MVAWHRSIHVESTCHCLSAVVSKSVPLYVGRKRCSTFGSKKNWRGCKEFENGFFFETKDERCICFFTNKNTKLDIKYWGIDGYYTQKKEIRYTNYWYQRGIARYNNFGIMGIAIRVLMGIVIRILRMGIDLKQSKDTNSSGNEHWQ